MTVFTQNAPNAAFILSEAAGMRSRDNALVAHGQAVIEAGTVLMSGDVNLTTPTADVTADSPTLENLSSEAGLVNGVTYGITGTGIPANTTFTYSAETGTTQTLSHNATGTHATETVTITRTGAGMVPWLSSADDAVGLNIYRIDPSADTADVATALITRDAEVNVHRIVYPDGTVDDAVVALAAVGIIAR